MRIGVLTEHDLEDWARDHREGRRPAAAPYMVDALADLGHEVVQIRPIPIPDKVAHKVEHRLGFGVRAALNLRAAVRCDVVLALLETQAWAYSALRGPLRLPPLVTLECWLADDLRRSSGQKRRALLQRARRLGHILSLSENQRIILKDAGVPVERTHVIPFAVATDFFTPSTSDAVAGVLPGDHDILLVGQDRGRDFGTFLEAMRILGPRYKALVVTKPEAIGSRELPSNVTLHGTVDHYEYRELLRRAPVAVIPTFELAYPTGQSVALEAAAVGTPIVVTRTPAMLEYVTPQDAEMPPVGDAEALAEALRSTLDERGRSLERALRLRARVLTNHAASDMWGSAAPVLERAARVRP